MRLQLRGISHWYGALHVLDALDLTLEPGEILAIIGPSGCGKSTLLGIMGGMLRAGAGEARVYGRPPADCLNPFTYVFQDFALLPWRTVAGNVALPLEHHGLGAGERQRRVEAALALTGLSEFARAYPRQLSGGMRQRVGIARAVAVRPAIFLLDEPLSALDAQTRELLMEDLLAIWARERTTSAYVTHNLDEALRVADRIAVLSRRPGRLKAVIPIELPQAERRAPAHAAAMAVLQSRLWSLIRDEAALAEREILHA
jgi:NitT/TauT family transport system ATP-binding protein